MNKEGIQIDKKALLEQIMLYPAADYKLFQYHDGQIVKAESHRNEISLAEYLERHKPSNTVSGFIIISSLPIVISSHKNLLDENVLEFIMTISQSNDGIPENCEIASRAIGFIEKKKYPFFLMPENFPLHTKTRGHKDSSDEKISERNALLIFSGADSKDSYRESIKLAEDAGYIFCGSEIVRTLLPKTRNIDAFVERITPKLDSISVIIFTSVVAANTCARLEKATGLEVIDREELIISLFDKRAVAHSGKIKVASSLIEKEKVVFKSNIGGLSRLKGGIGLKGPGETKEEERKRILKNKGKKIRNALEKESERLASQRKFRKRSECPTVSIVGYTNAGKSTLFNALLNAKVVAESSAFFSSIDPKIKKISLFGKKLFLVDTVGFIEGMSQGTMDTFNPTFQEIVGSSLTLHIIDPTDAGWREKKKFVEKLLIEQGVEADRIVTMFSKKELIACPLASGISLYSAKNREDVLMIKKMIFEKLFPKDSSDS